MSTTNTPRTYRQKRWGLRISFCAGDRLDYRLESYGGTSISKTVEWEALPSSLHFVENVEPSHGLIRITIMTTGFALLHVLGNPNRPLRTFCASALVSLVFVGAYYVVSRLWRTATTSLPVEGTNLVVLRDKLHDQIIEELTTRRTRRLADIGGIRIDQSARQNLLRLRWLVTEGAMTCEQFAAAQAAVVPGVSIPLLKEQFLLKSPRRFVQSRMGVRRVWDLLPDRVRYQHSTILGGETTLNVSYLQLPRCRDFDQVPQVSYAVFVAAVWFAIGIAAMTEQLLDGRPVGYYAGWIGARHGALDFAPMFAALVLGLALIVSKAIVRSSQLSPGITIIRDRLHDFILKALEQARLAALRWELQPDPLTPLADYAELLEDMKAELDLSDEQSRAWLAQARAMDEQLALDRPNGQMTTLPSQKIMN